VTDLTLIEATILELTTACGPRKSISPTDVAHVLAPEPGDGWRRHLTAIRKAAARLATAGRIEVLRKGKPVPPAELHGVIRLRIAPETAAPGTAVPDAPETEDI
jgi:hypothetical protein